jgi:F0F1-type ATP synthase epsilon subunit
MKLRIVTTQRSTEHEIAWAELNTPAGNMVIQHGHAPLMIELSAGHEMLYQKTDGSEHTLMIVQGIAHVNREIITVLLPIDL